MTVPQPLRCACAAALTLACLYAAPPATRVDAVKEVLGGVTIADPYRWLENQNSPETRAWIDAQNRYTRSMLDPLPGRDRLKKRLAELMKIDETGMPAARNGRYFFARRVAGQDQAVLYVRQGPEGKDDPLIDPNPWSPDHTTSVSLQDVSDDGSLLAYGVRRGGEDEIAVRFFDVNRRKDLSDALPRARYAGISFTGNRGFYYSRYEPQGYRIYYHLFGARGADPEIFGKGYGPDKGVSGRVSDDGRYLVIHVVHGSAADVTEIYVQDLANKGPIRPVVNDLKARFFGEPGGDTLFIHTNWQAPNGRVFAVDLANLSRDHWREVIPEGKSVLEGISAAAGRLFAGYLENVHSVVKVFTPEGKFVRDVPLPAIGTAGNVGGRWTDREAFFSFNSFHIPETIYRYDPAAGTQQVWARAKVPVDSGQQLETKQVWYASKDGTRIPMFLLHRKGLKIDGARPVFLTGYGGFNLSRTPEFSATAVLWAEMGGVFALPNLRGGGEFGEAWHRAGMLEKKQNVFDDFIGAAEWLVKNGYTNPARIAISGRSNGGLLVGAALTQRPDLFRAVVCGYPLLDMLRYQKFLIAKFWVPEYGSAEDPAQFKFLYAYSPYHRVKKGTKYPAVLFVTGDSDTRVAPLHARKMAALLQASTGSDRPVLLHYDTKAGHTRGLPIGKQIDDLSDELMFLFWQLGVRTFEK